MTEFNPLAPLTTALIEYSLWIIPALIGLAALRALLPRLKGVIGEAMVGGRLDRLFEEVLHDIIVPDGRGGLTQIDHVALTAEGLLAVETKREKDHMTWKVAYYGKGDPSLTRKTTINALIASIVLFAYGAWVDFVPSSTWVSVGFRLSIVTTLFIIVAL
jgi:Na+-transporting NADH:ubiquinone oxidoreductase subunit NqrB